MQEHIPDIRKIAFIGDYFPRKCGIATFTYDLRTAVAEGFPRIESFVAPVNDLDSEYDYPGEVRFEFAENDLDSYRRTAAYLNFSNADVVCLQHEYGIYGGPAGSFILPLLRDLRIPIVTTLHTVLEKPDPDQRRVLLELAALSARLVVMSERARRILREVYGIADEKIDLIAHGIPDLPFVDSSFYKDQFGVEGKNVLLTFGLLSPNKGIETMLRAIPEIVKKFPNLVYIVLGATHPNLVRENGEAYRLSLERLAQDLGIKGHVSFFNRFVDLEQLKIFLGVCDIYITPYLNAAQITSGTLAYAFGSGKAVISTPYWHAEELLADDRGVLVPFGDSRAMAEAVVGLLRDDRRRNAMRKKAYLLGREMTWDKTAELYMRSFERARQSPAISFVSRLALPTLAEERLELPELRLDHLLSLSDSTGILQHAIYTMADRTHGYCIDDNARALICTVLLEELEVERPELRRLSQIYASFLQYAFEPGSRRFHNFMSFDRRWLDLQGSEDSHGRTLWALGTCVGRSKHQDFQAWSAQLFERALPQVLEMTSPRAWAFALLGIYEYFRRLSGDRAAAHARDILTEKLIDLYDRVATPDWPWFEEGLSYDNARLSQVMILSGRWADNPRAFEIGLESLRWLVGLQKAPQGHFRPIGSEGFYQRGGLRADYDQQAIEAQATISACLETYRSTDEQTWHEEARIAFEWFLGRNDLGLPLYDTKSGGCCDGLHIDRVNQNQGAESTLAFLISLSEMELLEQDVKAFQKPTENAGLEAHRLTEIEVKGLQ
jgi:glycosyltransferase involved in cell wall biosynthesis